jgi:hypothetical protein
MPSDFCTVDQASSRMMCEFLPSYSPKFNSTELAFFKFKAYIRQRQHILISIDDDDEGNEECILFSHDAVWSVTLNNAEGYFRHCSYC